VELEDLDLQVNDDRLPAKIKFLFNKILNKMPNRASSPKRATSRGRVRSTSRSRNVQSPSRKFSVAKVLAPYKGCPEGEVKRKGYTRKTYTLRSGSRVRSSSVSSGCIKDRGYRSRLFQLKTGSMGIGPLKKGELRAFGYSADASEEARHKSLRAASKKYSTLSVLRKLNALMVYNKRTQPEHSVVYKADREYVSELHKKRKV
jgi:hypothetical protein